MEQAGIEMAEDAIQLARFRRTDAALGRAKLAVQLAPHLYQTWFILGSLYLQDDQVQPGIEALNQSLSLAPADAHANIKFSLGSAYFLGSKIFFESGQIFFHHKNSFFSE